MTPGYVSEKRYRQSPLLFVFSNTRPSMTEAWYSKACHLIVGPYNNVTLSVV